MASDIRLVIIQIRADKLSYLSLAHSTPTGLEGFSSKFHVGMWWTRQGWGFFRGPNGRFPTIGSTCRLLQKLPWLPKPSHGAKDSLLCVGLDPHKSELQEDSAEGAFRFCQRLIEDGWRWSWGWLNQGVKGHAKDFMRSTWSWVNFRLWYFGPVLEMENIGFFPGDRRWILALRDMTRVRLGMNIRESQLIPSP